MARGQIKTGPLPLQPNKELKTGGHEEKENVSPQLPHHSYQTSAWFNKIARCPEHCKQSSAGGGERP